MSDLVWILIVFAAAGATVAIDRLERRTEEHTNHTRRAAAHERLMRELERHR